MCKDGSRTQPPLTTTYTVTYMHDFSTETTARFCFMCDQSRTRKITTNVHTRQTERSIFIAGSRLFRWLFKDCVSTASQTLVNTEINLRIPQMARNFLAHWATISFSRRIMLNAVSINYFGYIVSIEKLEGCYELLFGRDAGWNDSASSMECAWREWEKQEKSSVRIARQYYLTMFYHWHRLYSVEWKDGCKGIGKHMEWTRCGPFEGDIPAFAWRNWGKLRIAPVSIANNLVYHPSRSLECYRYTNLLGSQYWFFSLSFHVVLFSYFE
jgi:hypothetical protein